VRKASRILVFDMGRIIELGTFDELVNAGGRFARLAEQQFISAAPIPFPVTVN
jgi:ATP-binding cassette subfamily B protein